MKSNKNTVLVLIAINVVTIVFLFILLIIVKLGPQELNEQNHHLNLKLENYKAHILSENKGLSIFEFKSKYNINRELELHEKQNNYIEHNLVYFKFKNGILNDIE